MNTSTFHFQRIEGVEGNRSFSSDCFLPFCSFAESLAIQLTDLPQFFQQLFLFIIGPAVIE